MFRIVLIITSLFMAAQTSAAYLGLRVQELPAHVRAHMPDNIAKNQGVIVDWLEDISPAADDGIKQYDVLISYNKQPITTPNEFYKKMQATKTGDKIDITLVRQGNVLTIPITTSDAPQNIKMTRPPRQSLLYHPAPEMAQSTQAPRFLTGVAPVRPLNIAGKPAFPMRKKPEVHAWGKERNIWPDFYTGATNDFWDSMINAPFKMGRMPGGWRAPKLSTPDPVTIGDAVTNQLPPMAEEMGNMMDISD